MAIELFADAGGLTPIPPDGLSGTPLALASVEGTAGTPVAVYASGNGGDVLLMGYVRGTSASTAGVTHPVLSVDGTPSGNDYTDVTLSVVSGAIEVCATQGGTYAASVTAANPTLTGAAATVETVAAETGAWWGWEFIVGAWATLKQQTTASYVFENDGEMVHAGTWESYVGITRSKHRFDLSATGIPGGATVTGVSLFVTPSGTSAATAVLCQATMVDGGVAPYVAADWGSGFQTGTEIADRSTGFTADTEKEIPLNAAGIAAVQAAIGSTFVIGCLEEHDFDDVAPADDTANLGIYAANNATPALRPRLEITYTV